MAKPGVQGPFVGVDLGGTNIVAGLMDAEGRILARSKKKTGADTSPDAVVRRILATVTEILAEARIAPDQLAAIGVGAPGPVDPGRGMVLKAPNLGWSDVPLADILAAQLKVPAFVDNDVNVGTWAEYVVGAGQGCRDMMGVFVGTGIGAGLVLDGRLYHGHFRTAGEIGHTWIQADAPLGRRTTENLASRTAIGFQLHQLALASHSTLLTQFADEGDLRNLRSKALAKSLEAGDELTRIVVQQAATYVGIAIANSVTLLSLPCVVLGGGLTEALGRTFVTWVRAAFVGAVFPPELAECRIVAGKLGDDAGMVGAAMVARDRLVAGT